MALWCKALEYSFAHSYPAQEVDMISSERLTVALEKDIEARGPWEHWGTVAPRAVTGLAGARRALKQFFSHLNTKERIFFRKYVICYVFYDTHRTRPGVHVHFFLRGIMPFYAPEVEKRLLKELGQAKVKPYILGGGAARYVAKKYVTGRLLNFELYRINSRLRKTGESFSSKIKL